MKNKKYCKDIWCEYFDKAAIRVDNEDGNVYEEKLKSSMRDFLDNNEDELKKCYDKYKTVNTEDFFLTHYKLFNEKDLSILLDKCKVLLLTANPIEKSILHYYIINEKQQKIIRILFDDVVYFIFKWDDYFIAHVAQNETGSYKDYGTSSTLQHALEHFTPNVIFSIGVAFGIDYETQKIGDVIVSKRILPYSENKRDQNIIKPDRNQDKKIDNWLHVRLENAHGFLPEVFYGDILTGGSVMSSNEEKDRVCLGYSKNEFIIGGEMEGNALFQIAHTANIPCAVIKGICDWGVAKNNLFEELNDSNVDNEFNEEIAKDSLQAFAMNEVAKKMNKLFSDKTLFDVPKFERVINLKRKIKKNRAATVIALIAICIIGIIQFFNVFNYGIKYSSESALVLILCIVTIIIIFVIKTDIIHKMFYKIKQRKYLSIL